MGLYDMAETYCQNDRYHKERVQAKQREFPFMERRPALHEKNLMTEAELELILNNPEVIDQTADNILIKIFRERRTM